MSDESESAIPDDEEFKDKIKSIQVPRQPTVVQRSEGGSTQTYHSSGRVDANVVIDQPIKVTTRTETRTESPAEGG